MRRLSPLLLTLLLPLGCEDRVTPVRPGPQMPAPAPEPVAMPDPVGAELGDPMDLELAPRPPVAEPMVRARRRMDIDQLDAAIRAATGGIGWTERRGGRDVNLFDELALTLGKPNFQDVTEEDLSPGAMFQKFLGDAARSVCADLFTREARTPEADRVFFVHAEPRHTLAEDEAAVRRNLAYLLLRYHGRQLAPESDGLERWTWLMRSTQHVAPEASGAELWRNVCVSLITHPDFYTY